jgi:hypothetical protein
MLTLPRWNFRDRSTLCALNSGRARRRSVVSLPPRAGENYFECRSQQARARQDGVRQTVARRATEIPNRRSSARQRVGRHAPARQQGRIAARHSPRGGSRVRTGRVADHLRRCGAVRREGVLSPDHDGFHHRHHAVAGRKPDGALPDSARRRGGPDRHRSRRHRHVHGRADRLAGDGMEQQASRARRAPQGKSASVRPAAGAVAGAAKHARRLRHAGSSNGFSQRWNSCRRPLPNSCCSSRP